MSGRRRRRKREQGSRLDEKQETEKEVREEESRERMKKDEEVGKVVMCAPGGDGRARKIFVKMDGMQAVLMEMSQKDKVHDVVRRILTTANESDQDVHVTSSGKMLKENEELGNCGARDEKM